MNIDSIIQSVDLALTIAFWSILGLLLIYFLVGLLRGWKQGTYRTLFMLIVLFTLLALLPVWIDIANGVNLQSMGISSFPVTLRGKTITVQATTLPATVENLVYGVLKDIYQVKSSVESITNFAKAFTASAIRLILVTVIAILTLIVGSLLAFLFWHILFKHLIPKPKRKPKIRIVSALEEVLVGALCLVLFISPMSAVVNSFQNYVDTTSLPESKNETVKLYKSIAETYDKSILNQAFFAWTKGSGKNSLDVQLAEFIAQSQVGSASANVITEMRALGASGAGILSLMASSNLKDDITTSLMMAPVQFAGNTVSALLSLSGEEGARVLSDLSAFAGTLSSSYDEVEKTLGQERVKRLSSPIKKQRSYAEDSIEAYRYLENAGVFETEVNPIVSLSALPVNDNPYLALTSSSTLEALNEVSASVSSSRVVDSLLHGYLLNRSKVTGIQALMPQNEQGQVDENAFAATSYLHEAKTIVSTFHQLNKLEPNFTKEVVGRIHEAESSQDTTTKIMNDALALFADSSKELIDLLAGPRDEKGEPIVDARGLSQNGCLLDSGLVNAAFPAALEIGATLLDDNLLQGKGKLDVGDLAVKLQGTKSEENIINDKREFGRILDVVGKMTENPYEGSTDSEKLAQGKAIADSAKKLLRDLKGHAGIDLDPEGNLYAYDATLFQAIAHGVCQVDASEILSALMPPIAEELLLRGDSALKQFDITTLDASPTDPNGKSTIGREIAQILAIGYRCPNVMPIFLRMGSYSVDSIARAMTSHADEFEKVLDIVSSSAILNPDFVKDSDGTYALADQGGSGETIHNLNFVKILNYLFEAFQIKNVLSEDALTDPSVVRMSNTYAPADNIVDYMAQKTGDNENHALIHAISSIMDSGILDALSDMASSKKIIQNLAGADIASIFSSIGDSFVLRRVVPGYFDDVLLENVFNADASSKVDLEGYGISFRNLGDSKKAWADEGNCFQDLVSLASKGIDLSNFDLFTDGEALMDIMSTLSQSKMFAPYALDGQGNKIPEGEGEYQRDYVFPSFFSDKLLAAAGDNASYFENENANAGDPLKTRCSSFIDACASLDSPAKWDASKGGEFAKLKDVFYDLSKIGSFDALSSFDSSSIPQLEKLLSDTAKTDTFSTVFLGNALGDAMKKVSGGDIDFSAAYTSYFYDEERSAPSYNRAAKVSEMQGQVEGLFSILKIVFDEKYGIADGSTIDMGKVKLNTISTDYFVEPLLLSAHSSAVFHPTEALIGAEKMAAYEAKHPYTLFEQLMGEFVVKSGAYRFSEFGSGSPYEGMKKYLVPLSASSYPSELSIGDIIKGIDDSAWEDEIDALCFAIRSIQEGDFVSGDGQLDFSKISDLNAFFGQTENKKNERSQWLSSFLGSIDDSALMRRSLPKILSDTLDTMNIQNEDILKDLRCVDFYFENASGNDYGPLTQGEIDKMVAIFRELSSCTKMDPSDISTLDGGALSRALANMETSKIFHSNVSKSESIFTDTASPSYAKRGHTAFENILADVIANDALASYLFDKDISPKDHYYDTLAEGGYSSALEKALFLIRQQCALPLDMTPNGHSGEAEIQKLGSFIDLLSSDALSSFMGGGKPDFDTMDASTLGKILHGLNGSAFLSDCVPNALAKTVSSSSSSFQVDGIEVNAANFYYCYDIVDADLTKAPSEVESNFLRRYDEAEIDQICFIMDALKQNQSILSDFKISKIDPMLLRSLLLDLSNSQVFHESGLPLAFNLPRHNWSYDSGTGKEISANDLTVFEQFIEKIYLESGLYKQNFDLKQNSGDLQLLLDNPVSLPSSLSRDESIRIAAHYKLHNNISLFSKAESSATYPSIKGNPVKTSWLNEISALTSDGHYHHPKMTDDESLAHEQDSFVGLIQVIQESGFAKGDTVDFGSDTLNKTEPSQIYFLFSALNHCSVINEALPNSFGAFVSGKGGNGIGIKTYSSDTHEIAGPVTGVSFDSESLGMKTSYQGQEIVRPAFADTVRFAYSLAVASDASDFASHFQVLFNGQDVTSYVLASKDGANIVLDVSQIAGDFEIKPLDGGEFSDIVITFDRADYRLTQKEYEDRAIPSVYYFFASAFRGQEYNDSYYYSFGEGSSAMGDFLNDPHCATGFEHSTFGLFYLLSGSGLFDNLSSDGSYAAKDFALYNLLDVKATVNSVEHELRIGADFHPTLGGTDVSEAVKGIHEITKLYDSDEAIRGFCFEEAAYLDQYIEELGYAEVLANRLYWDQFVSESLTDSAKIMTMNTLENVSYSSDTFEGYKFMTRFASSLEYSKSIELFGTKDGASNSDFMSRSPTYTAPGRLARQLIATTVRKMAVAYNAMAKLDHTSIAFGGTYLGTMASSRSAYMSNGGYTDIAAISSALTNDTTLEKETGKLGAVEALGEIVKALYYSFNDDREHLQETLERFDNATGGAKILIEQFYMGDLYDHLSSTAISPTLKKFDANNVFFDMVGDSNKLAGSNTIFSYAQIGAYVNS